MTDHEDRVPTPDTLEEDLADLLRRRAEVDPVDVERVRGSVASLPARRRPSRTGPILRAAAGIAVLLGLGVVALVNLPMGSTGAAPQPPDPRVFAGDPRLAACGLQQASDALYIFEIAGLADYPRHLPAAAPLDPPPPSTEAATPTLVVIRPLAGRDERDQAITEATGDHDVCLVSGGAADAEVRQLEAVDISGLTIRLDDPLVVTLPDGLQVLPPLPEPPETFAASVDFAACGIPLSDADVIFRMDHARDVARHLPGWFGGLDLPSDEPAIVVIGRGYLATTGEPVGSDATPEPQPTTVLVHDLCISVAGREQVYGPTELRLVVPFLDVRRDPPAPSPDPTDSGSPAVPSPIASDGPTEAPLPAFTSDLASQLECDGPVSTTGGEVDSFGAWDGAAAPESALQALLDAGVFASFPARGFTIERREGDLVLHAYRTGGRIKALAITSHAVPGIEDGLWHVIAIRSCDASEFDPADGLTFPTTLWRDTDGHLVRSDTIASIPGSAHCGWEATTFLRYLGLQYVRDPAGVLADRLVVPFASEVVLPTEAVDTGLHTTQWRLFTTRSGDAVYVRTADGIVERWGRARSEIGCA